MVQSLIFPIRYGIPGGENLKGVNVVCEGGLDLTQTVLEFQPGCASALWNFEASRTGGYRRILGYAPFSSIVVPGEGPIIGVHVYFPGYVLAARKVVNQNLYNIYYGQGGGWTLLNPSPLNWQTGMVVNGHSYNWNGNYKVVFTDGVNPAYTWDGSTYTPLNGSGSATNPKFCHTFQGYMFISGYSTNKGAVKVSAPLTETDWQPIDGALEFVVGDEVTWLQPWRDQLIIFCKSSIYKVTGNSTNAASSTPFILQQVTDRIGCLAGNSVQEIDGDLLFLAPDGIRPISGTFNIGDTEIASVSRPIQSIVLGINVNSTPVSSCVVHKKTQYRLFYNDQTGTDSGLGIVGAIRRFRDGHEAWEWGQLRGFFPYCADSGYFSNGNEIIVYGALTNPTADAGLVMQQETGLSMHGRAINELYTTVPLDCGDQIIRKAPQHVEIFATYDSSPNYLSLQVIYDLNDPNVVQPAAYLLQNSQNAARKMIQGSGKLIQFSFSSAAQSGGTLVTYDRGFTYDSTSSIYDSGAISIPSYTIQGIYIEFYPAGRR